MKFERISDDPAIFHVTGRYDEFPLGFEKLFRDEANWQKWVCYDASSFNYYGEAAYSTVDGMNVCGMLSDVNHREEDFDFVYQILNATNLDLDNPQLVPRAYKYNDLEGIPRMSQLFCFDVHESPQPDDFVDRLFADGKVPQVIRGNVGTGDVCTHNSQAYYAELLAKQQG